MIARLEHIRDETINNLIMKRVVCLSAIWNVGITREDQNDQDSTQRFLTFFGNDYNTKSSEHLSANEDNVASLPNLEDMLQNEALLVKCNNWHGKECDFQYPKGIFLMRGHVMTFDLKKVIMDDIL